MVQHNALLKQTKAPRTHLLQDAGVDALLARASSCRAAVRPHLDGRGRQTGNEARVHALYTWEFCSPEPPHALKEAKIVEGLLGPSPRTLFPNPMEDSARDIPAQNHPALALMVGVKIEDLDPSPQPTPHLHKRKFRFLLTLFNLFLTPTSYSAPCSRTRWRTRRGSPAAAGRGPRTPRPPQTGCRACPPARNHYAICTHK